MKRTAALFVAATTVFAISGCGAEPKSYDIGPIFPASADKCARYHGDAKGEGFTATCMVTQAECKKAAADWRDAMRNGGVNDAIQFTCD
jgi:hypothetical protein